MTHAEEVAGTNIDCPDGVYKGTFDVTFIKTDLGPIRNSIDDLLFFYGVEPKNPSQGNDKIQLKSLMICSAGGEEISTATRHIGSYTFLNKQCKITLNGRGQIKERNLVEQGDARLSCKDKSVYQGDYSITATNLLDAGENQGTGSGQQGAGAEDTGSSSSSKSWNGLITEPEQDKKKQDRTH